MCGAHERGRWSGPTHGPRPPPQNSGTCMLYLFVCLSCDRAYDLSEVAVKVMLSGLVFLQTLLLLARLADRLLPHTKSRTSGHARRAQSTNQRKSTSHRHTDTRSDHRHSSAAATNHLLLPAARTHTHNPLLSVIALSTTPLTSHPPNPITTDFPSHTHILSSSSTHTHRHKRSQHLIRARSPATVRSCA